MQHNEQWLAQRLVFSDGIVLQQLVLHIVLRVCGTSALLRWRWQRGGGGGGTVMDESKGGCDAERRSRGCARGSEHVLPVQRGTAAAGGSCCHGGGDEPGGGEASEHQCDGLQRVQVQVPARKVQQVRFCAAPRSGGEARRLSAMPHLR